MEIRAKKEKGENTEKTGHFSEMSGFFCIWKNGRSDFQLLL